MPNPLKIVSTENKKTKKMSNVPRRTTRRQEAQAKMERQWLIAPEQFNPFHNCMERERIKRTWHLIKEHIQPENKRVVDLGCGYGELSNLFLKNKAKVLALDISSYALKKTQETTQDNIDLLQDCIPNTTLNDEYYDVVLSTDVIAYLIPEDYRLYFAELCRLVKPKGDVVCSTPIDINSMDALQRFSSLAETEFQINQWVFSYHCLYIRLCDFFIAPSRIVRAKKDPEYREKLLNQKRGLARCWFKFNSQWLSPFWACFQCLTNPIARFLKQSRFLMLKLETLTQFIWSDSGISHAIFIGKRRPLISPPSAEKKTGDYLEA